MQSRKWIPVMPLASLFVLQATASYGQEAIGKATSVRPQAEGIHSGSTRTLSGGSDVYSKETVRIRTGDTGQANLQFHNDINLSVGPQSSVHLEKYVYDPNKSAGNIAVQADARLASICYGIARGWVVSNQNTVWDAWVSLDRRMSAECDLRQSWRLQSEPVAAGLAEGFKDHCKI